MSALLTLPHASALSIRAKALVFEDPESLALLARVEQIAPTEATVLIIGETGTGKELLARHVHQGSGRRGPFVAVNCGAFNESLIDAELFGHESGAFTGAAQARAGWFEAAHGGTLFLDEIGDLNLSLQVKLLRVLQERQVVRIGSRKPIALDVRLIAASNIDLRGAVRAGHFRADLYYRLSVATLELRRLCERPGDILPLARHFLTTYAARLNLARPRLTPEAQQALRAYDWPGNIRELENVIHYALIVAPEGEVRACDLQSLQCSGGTHRPPPGALPAQRPPTLLALREWLQYAIAHEEGLTFDAIEAEIVTCAFALCQRNQVHTAQRLGLSRSMLRTLLKRHGLLPAAASRATGAAAKAMASNSRTAALPEAPRGVDFLGK